MTRKRSAGLLLYRDAGPAVEVLLAHMGGPFWATRDEGAWTVPKGEYDEDETPEAAARREFQEELGVAPPGGEPVPLGSVTQTGGKVVIAWALRGELDPAGITPGTFAMEWPKGSGRMREFPEIDRVGWFGLDEARRKLVTKQRVFLDRLEERLRSAQDAEDAEGAGPGGE
ncbi:NUDIX domain-containing protein [Streptomyces rapamycinicus]|uniref:DNA mismatch repair protein MutT n=2 Tax=Streptomyces rapamycinicus TaxID=1226757 RepID=A0A3L8R582_STRRN|nr:NUDIX domain-containing protein [Streptomyces rapamycinicus]MBB4780572.1 putative NUDIX family NTP pyrophosphohydrolase [Streptomyces rapamycinicus]RLV74777.1 DNA mismatch repair protein MutT [Streptomyces rapamycinicus NRRL 5491]UTO61286.1 NUDIX domain-containing protein [Streptomyces rapamycinicus]UTP29233.1 NUDIX domain-containing protein [Streptomyces rapamycinicus NRRL 5491]